MNNTQKALINQDVCEHIKHVKCFKQCFVQKVLLTGKLRYWDYYTLN